MEFLKRQYSGRKIYAIFTVLSVVVVSFFLLLLAGTPKSSDMFSGFDGFLWLALAILIAAIWCIVTLASLLSVMLNKNEKNNEGSADQSNGLFWKLFFGVVIFLLVLIVSFVFKF